MRSVWIDEAGPSVAYPALDRSLEADTAVVGGGITGLSTALRLSQAGQRVAVLEAGRIGASNTGGSTGNLYATVSEGLASLRRKWGDDVIREVVAWRAQAVDWIEHLVSAHSIDCDFARRPLVRGIAGSDPDKLRELEDEFAAADAAGLAPRWLDDVPDLPFRVHRAFRIEHQAQFDPYRYARGLARVLAERGVAVHEHTRVVATDAGDGSVRTERAGVSAGHIVFATHSPLGINLVQAEMKAYREYGISARLAEGTPPEGIHWLRDDGQSLRRYRAGGRDYLIVVGAKHLVGHHEADTDYPERLRAYVRSRFRVDAFVHAWSAQQFQSADGLPYIGRSAHRNVLIATGFGADGLTWGTVASAVLTDLVFDRETGAGKRLNPKRFTPVKSAKTWASENAHVVRHLVGPRLRSADLDRLAQVQPGQGGIVELDGRKHAVYRADDGGYEIVSPVCTHMGCYVEWNGNERSWDCPCHGSRFRTDGTVIEGPAIAALENLAPERFDDGRLDN
jgi:glycine/D-amino acid oxidase-like deaminating enzyme/nitrite reductase/ring-hydroxylating ferredoxin subunit